MNPGYLIVAALASLVVGQASAFSRLPPEIPVLAEAERVTLDLRPLLAQARDVQITRVSVCRRVGSQCQETLWQLELPEGWQQPTLELLGDYPGASVTTRIAGSLHPGGSYNAFIHFNERGRGRQQTVSSLVAEFCLAGEAGHWTLLADTECRARRNAENQQGSKP